MSLHTAFTYNQVAGTKEIFHQRGPMLNKLHKSFNLKFISLNLRYKYTHLSTLAFTNMREEVFVHTVFFSFWDKHTPEGMLERNQEVCPANTYGTRALETRHRKSKTTVKAQTLQTTTDRLSKAKSKDFELRTPRERRRMSFTQTKLTHKNM